MVYQRGDFVSIGHVSAYLKAISAENIENKNFLWFYTLQWYVILYNKLLCLRQPFDGSGSCWVVVVFSSPSSQFKC